MQHQTCGTGSGLKLVSIRSRAVLNTFSLDLPGSRLKRAQDGQALLCHAQAGHFQLGSTSASLKSLCLLWPCHRTHRGPPPLTHRYEGCKTPMSLFTVEATSFPTRLYMQSEATQTEPWLVDKQEDISVPMLGEARLADVACCTSLMSLKISLSSCGMRGLRAPMSSSSYSSMKLRSAMVASTLTWAQLHLALSAAAQHCDTVLKLLALQPQQAGMAFCHKSKYQTSTKVVLVKTECRRHLNLSGAASRSG